MGICSTDSPQLNNKHRSWFSEENIAKLRQRSQIHSGSWAPPAPAITHIIRAAGVLPLPYLHYLLATGDATASEWNGKVGAILVVIFFGTLRAIHKQPTSPTPPIASYAIFYITLTTELADDISLRHTVVTFYSSSRSLTLTLTPTLTLV